jgi:argininosuccinate lyase
MGPVWEKRLRGEIKEQVLRYCSGRDVNPLPAADEYLIPYDIWSTEAHNVMLYRQGLLSPGEVDSILRALAKLRRRYEDGRLLLDPVKEDVHMNLEAFISQECGEVVGMKVHTGRSRNDQVTCDVRMYLRDKILVTAERLITLIRALAKLAESHLNTFMPGYSHTRHATSTTFAHLLASYAYALERDVSRFQFAWSVINTNPLGSVAGFGTSWPLDRELTAVLLGFETVQQNTLDSITSRWEAEAQLASAYCFMMNHLAILCQDFIFLSTAEANMVHLTDAFVQGSSVMPHKRNPDPLEITRAKASLAQGTLTSLLGIAKGCSSGYNRDSQYTKYLIMDLVGECELAPVVLADIVSHLQVNRQAMERWAREDFLYAADFADHLARHRDLPFRKAYQIVAEAVRQSQKPGKLSLTELNRALRGNGVTSPLEKEVYEKLMQPAYSVNQRSHTGAPASEAVEASLKELEARVVGHAEWVERCHARLRDARQRITAARRELEQVQ